MTDSAAQAQRRIIAPAPFQAAPLSGGRPDARETALPWRALAVMLLLVLGALALLTMLPRWAPPPAAGPALDTAQPATATAPSAVAAPLDDEQRNADARRTAQILLRATLGRLTALQTRQVESWDRSGLRRLQEALAHGEKAYSEKRFRAAQDAYRTALVEAAHLESELPAVITGLLHEGDKALEQGRSAPAAAAFEQVLAIEPEQHDAKLGRARAASLDRVRALVEQAEAYEQMGAPDKARAVYNDAARLDARAASVKAGLARLDALDRAERLRVALSAGHVALERGDFNNARQAFKRAAALDARNADVIEAQHETERRAAAADIAAALQRATRAVQSEAWNEAARSYGAALALDAELGAAEEGKRAAEQRAQLDTQLESLRQDTLALTEQARREVAAATLTRAQALAQPGPRLRGQMAALSTALRQAREALQVSLSSDGQTEIAIDGVGALGRFTERVVTLLPGRYQARGQRDGQADVRIEFVVTPGASAPHVSLQSAP